MAVLGGSPLGLIGVGSGPTRDGMSTFVGDKSRNLNVNDYNAGGGKTGNKSIFYGNRTFKAFPEMGSGPESDDTSPTNYKASKFHSDSLYDTSLLNILEKLSGTKAQLRSQDFAYLKNVGVYPNNRLMIARRFQNPMVGLNNIYKKGDGPLATMVSWKPEGEDFVSIKFGEKWDDADADFTGILNEFGGDFSKKLGGLGGAVSGALGSIPLPGFSESIQRSFLTKLGIFNEDDSYGDLPAGDPNLIKMAKKRTTIAAGSPGAGLNCSFSIKMTCEWEQKFISGIDPTLVWLDIIALVLRFGTSKSNTYGLSATAGNKINGWAKNPDSLVTAVVDAVSSSVTEFKTLLDSTLGSDGKEVKKTGTQSTPTAGEAAAGVLKVLDTMVAESQEALRKTITKYRERVVGIVNALSGLPSGPWHVTIGNPMRPVFTSGDLIIEGGDVTLTFGPTLAFNDLPTTMRAEFSLVNARPLGLQEIMARFNSGYLRSVDYTPSSSEKSYANQLKANASAASAAASTGATPSSSTTPAIPGPVKSDIKTDVKGATGSGSYTQKDPAAVYGF